VAVDISNFRAPILEHGTPASGASASHGFTKEECASLPRTVLMREVMTVRFSAPLIYSLPAPLYSTATCACGFIMRNACTDPSALASSACAVILIVLKHR
jgi:hypothetical protein